MSIAIYLNCSPVISSALSTVFTSIGYIISDEVGKADLEIFQSGDFSNNSEKNNSEDFSSHEKNIHQEALFLKKIVLGVDIQLPCSVDDLISLIEYRKKLIDENLVIQSGELKLYKLNNILVINSNSYNLTDKEVLLLDVLMNNKGKVISKDDLLQLVWGYDDNVYTNTLETHIYRLRKKIGIDIIHSSSNGGYYI